MTIPSLRASSSYWTYSRQPAYQEKTSSTPGSDPSPFASAGALSEPIPPVMDQTGTQREDGLSRQPNSGECQTCANRKYQDGSNDPGVSFKTPTALSPEEAASMVRAHEMEHVVRNQQKAMRENREVVSQSVTYHTAICPECGRVYVSGGTTRTVTRGGDLSRLFEAGVPQEEKGRHLSLTA